MKVLFIHRKWESNAIERLSSVLKEAGHKTDLIFEPSLFSDLLSIKPLGRRLGIEHRICELVENADPDLIAFSVSTLDYNWACRIANRIRDCIKTPIVFGGIHPTLVPEEVIKNDFVDYLVVGEGEYALRELVNSLESGKIDHSIKNIWSKKGKKVVKNQLRPLIQDLDELPFPDKDIFYNKFPMFQSIYSILTSRGCQFQCTFCCSPYVRRLYENDKNFIRRRSVDHVMEELEIAKKKYGKIEIVDFEDDIFTSDEPWLEEFSKKYRDTIGIPYECLTHSVFINDRIGRALSESGCNLVEIGVQSYNEGIRRNVLRRYETNEQIEEAVNILTKEGIFVGLDHIIGFPGESIEDLIKFARMIINYPLVLPSIYKLAYFPKTGITDMVFGKKMVDGEIYANTKDNRINESELEVLTGIDELSGRINIDSRYTPIDEYSIDLMKFCFFLTSIYPILPKKINETIINREFYKLIPNNKYLRNLFTTFLNPVATKVKFVMNNRNSEWHYLNLKERLYMYPYFTLHR